MTVSAPSRQPTLALIEELLAEQQQLQTPVARYSVHHDVRPAGPALEVVYRDLIPLTQPQAGEQYAFEVDLDSCSGCKACVAGCHSLNGLDDHETWRDVGLLVGGTTTHPYQQTITSACHHCADPGCLNGCPVLAYEKDPVTGIVRHLDDQCIGCSYCILKCPYDVPKFSARLGIVRKCDMCHGRLAAGEAPACVQACPTHAIRIVTVPVPRVDELPAYDTSSFLASAPDPTLTQPTTRYVSRQPLPGNARAADADRVQPQPGHLPLAVMLVLTQLAVGLQWGAWVTRPPALVSAAESPLLLMAWIVAALGLAASVLHLGRPLRAWRIFLGLRRSWLSREAVVLGAWFGVASAIWSPWALPDLLPLTAALGAVGVVCSAMIYCDTGRRAWTLPHTAGRFAGTALVAASWAISPLAGALVLLLKLAGEAALRAHAPASVQRLHRGRLAPWHYARLGCGWAGALLWAVPAPLPAAMVAVAAIAVVAGELLERSLYFRTVDASAMPGHSSS